ncbi:MAG: chorismate-binding protein [Fidelibacterota bacterium]
MAVSGEIIRGDIFTNFQQTLDKWKSESEGISAVGFFSYDAKDLFFPHINFKASVGWIPKIWFGKPDQIEKYDPKEVHGSKPNYIRELKTAGEPIEKGKYFKDLSSIKENLEKGNVYQINYTYPMKFEVETNPYSLYRRLREISSPANGMYLNTDKFSVLSLSPERFIRKKNNEIETFPIKGTPK